MISDEKLAKAIKERNQAFKEMELGKLEKDYATNGSDFDNWDTSFTDEQLINNPNYIRGLHLKELINKPLTERQIRILQMSKTVLLNERETAMIASEAARIQKMALDAPLSETERLQNQAIGGTVVKAIETGNPKDKIGVKKPQLNLVPASSILYQALAMEDGARKYGAYNWRDNKVILSIYIAAAKRHIDQFYDAGEELASDSQKPHLGHALACLGIIVDAIETGNIIDDRPTPSKYSELLDKWTKK
jgi:hypothetical protein